jgi:hypothetical protein
MVVADVHDLPLPLGTPAGDYVLLAGLSRGELGAIADSEGTTEVRLGQMSIDQRPGGYTRKRLDLNSQYVNFGPVTLLGDSVQPDPARPATNVEIQTLWRSDRETPQSLNLRVDIVGPAGSIPLGGGTLGGRYSSVRWAIGELVRDRQSWRLPADLPDGSYQVRVGVDEGPRQAVGTLQVAGRPHDYTVPTNLPNTSGVRLGGRANLLGWSVKSVESSPTQGDTVLVTLYWQAGGPLDGDYSVFVHLSGADSRIIAQHDGQPQDGVANTAGWLLNEVITDKHIIRVPAGTNPESLRIFTGMYEPRSGRRLQGPRGIERIDLGPLRFDR